MIQYNIQHIMGETDIWFKKKQHHYNILIDQFKPIINIWKWDRRGQRNPMGAFPSSVSNTWQQRVTVKQWCGCWALQQLHRHKERHHYSEPRAVNRPATWGACRLCTGFREGREEKGGRAKGGQGWGRRTRWGRSVWDRTSRAGGQRGRWSGKEVTV